MTFSGWMTGIALAAFLSMPAAAAQPQDKAEVALRAAMEKETVEGDVKGAIEQYKKLAQNTNKSVAAQALVRLGECYEKQGNADARKTYEQVLSKFGYQKEAVAQARARLAALGGSVSAGGTGGFVTRRVLTDASGVRGVLTPDGKYISNIDGKTGDMVQFEIASGQTSRITNRGPVSEKGDAYELPVYSRDGKQIAYCSYTKENDWGPQLRIRSLDG